VLIDEFQDTNAIQYAWALMVAGAEGAPFIVGDDDQSIYRWRGARVENLTRFSRDYPAAKMYRLEQNYRSTGNILKAANTLIANNTGRLGKNLWTSGADGDRIKLYGAFNERDEADFVMNRIREWTNHGGLRREVAILYRSNAQSRAFEEAFLSARIPYKVYGGLRFFERAEIKDALAYLRLISSRADDASFERVVNLPTRGIGATTLDKVRDQAKSAGTHRVDSRRALRGERRARPEGRGGGERVPEAHRPARHDVSRARAARTGRPCHQQLGPGRAPQEGKGRSRRGARRKPERTGVRRARLRARRGEVATIRRESCHRSRLSWRMPCSNPAKARRRMGRLRADDDAAHGQGTRVPVVFLCGMEDGCSRTSVR
jgi:superfamily I DNA/RNA helicase